MQQQVLPFIDDQPAEVYRELLARLARETTSAQLASTLPRVRSEQRLELSGPQFRLLFDHLASGLLVTLDEDGRLLLANQHARRLLCLPPSIAGVRLGDVVDEATGLLADKRAQSRHLEVTLVGGERCLLGYTNVPLQLPQGLAIVTLFRDIRPILEAEQRRRRAEQLAQVGEMAARLSHEIKNPLATIVAGVQLLARERRLDEMQRVVVDGVLEEVRSISSTVEQLLDAARPREMKPKAHDLAEIMRDAVALPMRELAARQGVSIALRARDAAVRVAVDEHLFKRVITNLVLNAIEAMAEVGGELHIEWGLLRRGEIDSTLDGYRGEVAMIDIRDQGPGMTPDLLARAFKPFFTTKAKGNGLGLALALEIVEAHGGLLRARREPDGPGMVFRVMLAANTMIACPGRGGVSARHDELSDHCRGDRADGTIAPESCRQASGADDCRVDCAVHDQASGYCCWQVMSTAEQSDYGRWPAACSSCAVFRRGNLLPFAAEPGDLGF